MIIVIQGFYFDDFDDAIGHCEYEFKFHGEEWEVVAESSDLEVLESYLSSEGIDAETVAEEDDY